MNNFKIGQGYDIHKLVSGIPLILAGVEIEFDKGLHGHSDGDVVTHAVIDALLGASGCGDIGQLYPPTDQSIKGIDSQKMLARVGDVLKKNGYSIGNIDATVVCQKPKLANHYNEMKQKLASSLGIEAKLINIKAKTAEKLGPTGEGKSIEAHAVALIFSSQD